MEPIGEMHIIRMTADQLQKNIRACRFEKLSYPQPVYFKPPSYEGFNSSIINIKKHRKRGKLERLVWG